MPIIQDLLNTLSDAPIREVRVGAFWTAVVADIEEGWRCGLASTLRDDDHHQEGGASVRDAGQLAQRSAKELAMLIQSSSLMEAAIGMAAINALLSPPEKRWVDLNAEKVIAKHGAGKNVTLVGHFPFVSRLRDVVGNLWVLEKRPGPGDLPAQAAADVIPHADVLAITGTTLINHTFEDLMALRQPNALVLVLGPSTPLSPILFDYGVDILSGSVVENLDAVLRAVSQGANFRQVHQQGVRLVTMQKDKVG
jgi:uncharacterized protein (DUF4213/DUF364 family)